MVSWKYLNPYLNPVLALFEKAALSSIFDFFQKIAQLCWIVVSNQTYGPTWTDGVSMYYPSNYIYYPREVKYQV